MFGILYEIVLGVMVMVVCVVMFGVELMLFGVV